MNVRLETMKFLEENICGKLLDINLGDDFFLYLNPKAKATRANVYSRTTSN